MVSVLFVCLGNICRSPTAEGVFRDLVEREGLGGHIRIDSAGTHAYHIGEPPDGRAQAEAKRRGIDISGLRGRQARAQDFAEFDYVLAMDRSNHQNLLNICPADRRERLSMFLNFAPAVGCTEVPDPYYEGGFDSVYDMIEQAAHGLLADIRAKHL
ncbi:low molecular weight protein-tyrosine-phosphatase [Magnetovibrio sp.]|uniref:low molecular weight protein-tyrosine-phosphatase n=1 Tax=Magnetovibrio sp. TaxID=2024836 RepID=UPI002F932D51